MCVVIRFVYTFYHIFCLIHTKGRLFFVFRVLRVHECGFFFNGLDMKYPLAFRGKHFSFISASLRQILRHGYFSVTRATPTVFSVMSACFRHGGLFLPWVYPVPTRWSAVTCSLLTKHTTQHKAQKKRKTKEKHVDAYGD